MFWKCRKEDSSLPKTEAAAGIGCHLFAVIREIQKAGREMRKQKTNSRHESQYGAWQTGEISSDTQKCVHETTDYRGLSAKQ